MGERRLAVHEHYPPSRGCVGGCGNYREGRECCCPGERGEPTAADLVTYLQARPGVIVEMFGGDAGPPPWQDGDPRCHCTHCEACGRLYPTDYIRQHRDACPGVTALALIRAALAGKVTP